MADLEATPIGVRIGEVTLYTASPIGVPTRRGASGISVSAGDLRTQLGRLRDRACRRRGRNPECDPIDRSVERRREAIVAQIDDAAREVCEYARTFTDPVVVTADGHGEADLRQWVTGSDPRCGWAWLLPTAHRRLRSVAAYRSIPTATVPIAYSAQECAACGMLGERRRERDLDVDANVSLEGDRDVDADRDGDTDDSTPTPTQQTAFSRKSASDSRAFRCQNPDCPVECVPTDSNTAVVLAQRYRSRKRCRYHPFRSTVPMVVRESLSKLTQADTEAT